MLGVFWNPQKEQNSKLSMNLNFDKEFSVKSRVEGVRSAEGCISSYE